MESESDWPYDIRHGINYGHNWSSICSGNYDFVSDKWTDLSKNTSDFCSENKHRYHKIVDKRLVTW